MRRRDEDPLRGEHIELVPSERIRYTDRFENPNLPGDIRTTVVLKKVAGGTELDIVQEWVPSVIPPEAFHLGWQDSLVSWASWSRPTFPTDAPRTSESREAG